MRTIIFGVSSLFLVVAVGCGGPVAGAACNKAGFACQDASSALECRVKKWTVLPCRGTGGCLQTGDTVTCDMNGNYPDDLCASTAEGKGLCNATGTATLECRLGKLEQTNTCSTCTVSGGQVVCSQ